MPKEDLKENLIKLGLTKAEIEVYFYLLSHGSQSIQEITKETKLPRSTINLTIEKFLADNIVRFYMVGKRKNYVIEDPENLINLITKQEREMQLKKAAFQQLLPKLDTIHFLKSQGDIKVEFLEGEEGFKKQYLKTLELKKGQEILRFGVSSEKFTILPEFLREYRDEKNKKGIRTRLLLPEGELAKMVQGDDKNDLRETRFLDKKTYDPKGMITIWDNKLSFTAWDKKLKTIIIDSEPMAEIMRSIFETCWKSEK